MFRARAPMVYSRAERLSDAAVHVVGVVSALVAAPVLITLAAVWLGDPTSVIAASIYGLSLIGVMCCSALYHLTPLPHWKDALRRVDQSAIYMKIAGSYTPFVMLAGGQAGLFLTGLWGIAIAGAAIIVFSATRVRWIALALYLGMGWAGVIVGGPLLESISTTGLTLLLAAGIIYTLGVVFFLWERLPFHITIWHVFVLAASAIIYAAVLVEVSARAGALAEIAPLA